MLQSCCAKASSLWPVSHFGHICLGAGTPAMLLPLALTDPRPWRPGQPRGGMSRSEHGALKPASPLLPCPLCLLQGWAPPPGVGSARCWLEHQKAHSRPERPRSLACVDEVPAFRSPHQGSCFTLGAELRKGGGEEIRPSLGPTKPHTSLWATWPI